MENHVQNTFDFIIAGGGIIGSLIARELTKTKNRVLLIEKEADIGMGASGANSAIIHAGYDPRPGTLKAEMNARGNKLWEETASLLDIPFKRTGSYVVAIGGKEFGSLEPLYRRGIANSVPGLCILQREEFLTKEPLINQTASGALYAPSAGVIDPFMAVIAAAENSVKNSATILTGTELLDLIVIDNKITGIKTNRGEFFTRWLINAAGTGSAKIMHMAGVRTEFNIRPRRGEYLIFDSAKISLNNVLFPVPTDKGKGTLVSTTVHGNVMIGPNSVEMDWPGRTETSEEGLGDVLGSALKLVPSLKARDIIAQFAGLRSSGGDYKDFIIEIPAGIKGMVNVTGIDSPGFASAPAIAERVMELLTGAGENFKFKKDFEPVRKASPCFHRLSHKEKAELVRKNPAYGRIVCRCEEVTEGEVIDAIKSPAGATTYDGIKRRTWLGTGRCQGSFDYPRVIDIMSRELGIKVTEITKKGAGSEIVFRHTKDKEGG